MKGKRAKRLKTGCTAFVVCDPHHTSGPLTTRSGALSVVYMSRFTRTERRAIRATAGLVTFTAALGIYTHVGGVLDEPIVIHTSITSDVFQSRGLTIGDLILIDTDAPAHTETHERLHHTHPDWTECEVSAETLVLTGERDAYQVSGQCDAGHTTNH